MIAALYRWGSGHHWVW